MNVLFVYPKYPDTFWSFKHALRFISKKAVQPPLGLLTVAAMVPDEWNKRLIDLNVATLRDRDLQWADYVLISAMIVQKDSARDIIARCMKAGVKTVAGGPLFTACHEDFEGVDHFVLNEAEVTFPQFLSDLEKGEAKHLYTKREFPEITATPIPLWELADMKKYVSMNIQYSRGCPFNCEFCDITVLFGRKVRTKSSEQIISEIDRLYSLGWRGEIFIVDDNFIGNRKKLKAEVLPAMIEWNTLRKRPFSFFTETSIDLADDEELMNLMVEAGFTSVFVGIETPDEKSLTECMKYQNKGRDLVASVKKIQAFGLDVRGGFIVGFDSDTPSIFERQIRFIQNSGIVTAMVGLLNAPKGTPLYKRIVSEGRLLSDVSGDNTDVSINFVPKMDFDTLINGYKKIISGIYSPQPYYERVKSFMREYRPAKRKASGIRFGKPRFITGQVKTLFKSIALLGIKDRERIYFWKLFFWSLFRRPQLFSLAITYSIYGFHFRKVFAEYI